MLYVVTLVPISPVRGGVLTAFVLIVAAAWWFRIPGGIAGGLFAGLYPVTVSSALMDAWLPATTAGRVVQVFALSGLGAVVGLMAELRAHLTTSLKQVEELTETLQTQALTDALTGVANRRSASDRLQAELARAQRASAPLGVALCDIDRFKLVNDTHGHERGDETLRRVAERLGSVLRSQDYQARWGGEEFLVLLPDTDVGGAQRVAERMRGEVEAEVVDGVGQVTISIGVAGSREGDTAETLVDRADSALYAAKHAGRNRVVTSDALPSA